MLETESRSQAGSNVQASARNDAIEMKQVKVSMPITWVAEDNETFEKIKILTDRKVVYMVV
ncbi:MAG: hypothetical protein ACP5RT_02540 [Candidatus Micrarchaeia archaeon]